MNRIFNYFQAKWRAHSPLFFLQSPRPDVLRGISRWRWLHKERKRGKLVDPTVEIRSTPPEAKAISKLLLLGKGCAIDKGCIIWLGGKDARIQLGERVYVAPYTYLGACHKLEVGTGTLIGSHCYLITDNHGTNDLNIPIADQGYVGGDIKVGEHAWIGSHVVILPGVTIGDKAVIGAGAVVTKDVPGGEIWGGVPARKIKDRK